MNDHLPESFRGLVALRPVPSRWWYLPFLLVEGSLAFLALAGGLPGGPEYLVVALIFLAQTIRPTLLGWRAAVVAWFAIEFLEPLYERLVYRIAGLTPAFLVCWGLLPLVLLYFMRPRRAGLLSRPRGGGPHAEPPRL